MANDTLEIESGIHFVTDEEGRAILDRVARRYLNMSGEEFLRAWKEGRFSQNGGCPDLRAEYVSMLIPFAEAL
ncbi:conserved hypothetical protein [Candidatus Sulfopaludibacter sp. SbA4]|nr:conserved hypothetical protein [Candidatus Sulfopaludibacter sp. SbA4]